MPVIQFQARREGLRQMLAAMRARLRDASAAEAVAIEQDAGCAAIEMRLRFGDRTLGLLIRPEQRDVGRIRRVFRHDSPLRLPPALQPRVIFDVGAGIGAASVYLALAHPQAEIVCFEPDPACQEILRRNTQRYSERVRIVSRGLLDAPGRRAWKDGVFAPRSQADPQSPQLAVTTVTEALRVLNLEGVDVLHLNAPGSELAILHGMPSEVRQSAMAYAGQLHGGDDWDVCAMLARTHELRIHKDLSDRRHDFLAVRRDLL